MKSAPVLFCILWACIIGLVLWLFEMAYGWFAPFWCWVTAYQTLVAGVIAGSLTVIGGRFALIAAHHASSEQARIQRHRQLHIEHAALLKLFIGTEDWISCTSRFHKEAKTKNLLQKINEKNILNAHSMLWEFKNVKPNEPNATVSFFTNFTPELRIEIVRQQMFINSICKRNIEYLYYAETYGLPKPGIVSEDQMQNMITQCEIFLKQFGPALEASKQLARSIVSRIEKVTSDPDYQ